MNEELIDTINIVFFGIEGNLLPWTAKARKVQFLLFFLFRFQKSSQYENKANKPIFGWGAAIQFLTYYWATDMLQCEVINGDEKGSDIKTITDYSNKARKRMSTQETQTVVGSVINYETQTKMDDFLFPYKDNFCFLDHSNGDYYWFKSLNTARYSSNNDTSASSTNIGNNELLIYRLWRMDSNGKFWTSQLLFHSREQVQKSSKESKGFQT